jgi:uncharacterized protein
MPLPRFSDLTLILTERCNLSCDFCYVPKRHRAMSPELALRAVDWLVDRAPEGARPSVGFFGGEPLLARELCGRVVAHGRRRLGDGIRFTMPTNGTLVDGAVAAELRQAGVELALSVDDASDGARGQHTLEGVRPNLEHLRPFAPIVRMTVTPRNVENLVETVVRLFQAGFVRIMHQPALERSWPEAAVQAWRAQHAALADWACERLQRREPLPRLTVLEGIIARLGGRGPVACGAGVRTAAVDPDGRVFGCYRSVYDPRPERLVLADLRDGWVNEPLVAAYARLHPNRARPEERGSCRGCPARDGCTVFCPATGHVLLGNLRAVPADACRLMTIQVEICRELARRTRRIQRARRGRIGSRVAAAALALGLAGGSAACDNDRSVGSDATVDGPPPGLCDAPVHDTVGPGLCDATPYDTVGPGVCPWPGPEGGPDLSRDISGPGMCPPPLPDAMVPGICPIAPDVGVDMIGPGLCNPMPDGMIGPGLCNPMPDGMIGPGLCPVPIPDGGKPTPGLC